MDALGPARLAARQRELDLLGTRRFRGLYEVKRDKLAASPHAFLRGSAPLFFELLARRPDLARGPGGEGWIVGDMHLENVGAYRTDDDRVAFDVNDFDDAVQGPFRLDVLRLATSVLLAGRTFGTQGPEAIALARTLVTSWRRSIGGEKEQRRPKTIATLVERASGRQREDLLDARAPKKNGRRRFVRGLRYRSLPAEVSRHVPALLELFRDALGDAAPPDASEWTVIDSALRIAGTGSLGRMRLAVLVVNESGRARMLEFKEASAASGAVLLGERAQSDPARRVVEAAHALVAHPHRFLAAIPESPLRLPFVGRQLWPQEDKLDLAALEPGVELTRVVSAIGHTLGRAHQRSVTKVVRWSESEAEGVLLQAVELAGIFEAIYLAWCARYA